jgi:chitinase
MNRILQFLIVFCIFTANLYIVKGSNLVGFWHNWNDGNAPYVHLDSINDKYDYIEVSFTVPTSTTDMTMLFSPDIISKSEFISKVQNLKNKGKKVILSIGGATSSIDLTSQSNKTAFINSLTDILNTYGFDGLDIDIEHGNSILITGGTIANPTNVAQINLIEAIKQIMSNFRSNFSKKMLLTISPETAYVQGGQSGFGSIWGGYLPIIHALRDSLDIVQVQLYNSGSMYGLDGNIYSQGSADFIIAMTEAVIRGFNTNGGFFNGIPANKVGVGLPASQDAAGGGFVDTATVLSAMNYLLGKGSKPGSYSIIQQGAYPNLRGMMTWSINWDAKKRNGEKYQFANNYQRIFRGTVPNKVELIAPNNNAEVYGNIELKWIKNPIQTTAYQISIYSGTNLVFTDSTIIDTTKTINWLSPGTTYSWKARAKNNLGWGEWSDSRNFNVLALPSKITTVFPSQSELIKQNNIKILWNKSNPQVTNYHLSIVSDGKIIHTDSTITDTTYSINLLANKSYEFQIRAQNPSGWGNWSDLVQFSTIALPSSAKLLQPSNNLFLDRNFANFVWNSSFPDVSLYHIEIYRNSNLEKSDSMITDTSYYYSNLLNKSEYTWKIRAKNVFGWGNWSEMRKFTYLMLPSVVELLKPENKSIKQDSNIKFVWKGEKNNPTNYHIEISNSKGVFISDSTIIDTTYSNSNLAFGEEYSWRERAKNQSGWGEWSQSWVFSIKSKPIELAQKVILLSPSNGTILNDSLVQFKWNQSRPQVSGYNIEISQNELVFFADSTISDTAFVFTSLKLGEKYSWRVRAKNQSGWGEWSDFWVFSVKSKQIGLAQKVNLISPTSGVILTDTIVKFNWNQSTPQVTGYNIEINHNDILLFLDSTISDTSFVYSSSEFGKEYSWRVRARNSSGWGEWSEFWMYKIEQINSISESSDNCNILTIDPNAEYIEINLERSSTFQKGHTTQNKEITIYNNCGESMMNIKSENLSVLQRINISHLINGLYFIKIGNYIEKFLLVR